MGRRKRPHFMCPHCMHISSAPELNPPDGKVCPQCGGVNDQAGRKQLLERRLAEWQLRDPGHPITQMLEDFVAGLRRHRC